MSFLVASGKPLQLHQRTATVMSLSVNGRGEKVERGTLVPGIGHTRMVKAANSSNATIPCQTADTFRKAQAASTHHFGLSAHLALGFAFPTGPIRLATKRYFGLYDITIVGHGRRVYD